MTDHNLSVSNVLLIIIIFIALALFVIVYVVNKKLNDIQINIPPCPKPICNCPNPVSPVLDTLDNSYASYHKSDTLPNINIENFAANNSDDIPILNQSPPNTTLLPDYVNNNTKIKQNIPVLNTQQNTQIDKINLRQGYSNNDPSKPNINDAITYPKSDDILRYDNYGCYKQSPYQNDSKIVTITKDNNTDNNNMKNISRPYTDNNVVEGGYNIMNVTFMSPLSNEIKDIEKISMSINVPKVYMGRDPYISGVSYATETIDSPADVDQIGSIPVNDYNGEPVPVSSFSVD